MSRRPYSAGGTASLVEAFQELPPRPASAASVRERPTRCFIRIAPKAALTRFHDGVEGWLQVLIGQQEKWPSRFTPELVE